MIAKLGTHSRDGERQFPISRPTSSSRRPPARSRNVAFGVFSHSLKLSIGTRQRRRRIASRNAGRFSIPSALALMLANPTLMSLAQNGTKPQRGKSRLRSPALA
jgi:hypothetical protein